MNTKTLATVALLIALSFVGAQLTIMGTIAFDSLPAFLAALLLGPFHGAVIGFLGHMLTALTSGFPFSLPLHFVIALSMALTMYVFGTAYKTFVKKFHKSTALTITGVIGMIFNIPVSLTFSIAALWLLAGRETALGLLILLPALTMATIANIAASIALFKILGNIWSKNS